MSQLKRLPDSVAHDLVAVFRSMDESMRPAPVPLTFVPRSHGRDAVPKDRILDAWAAGIRGSEIRRTITRINGQPFDLKTIQNVIYEARAIFDPRAAPRKPS